MKALIYLVFLSEFLKRCGSSANNKRTFLMEDKAEEIFLRRSKRYLVFEKGATLTIQANIAKSIIPPAPRGLNVITEYTLSYELPSSDLDVVHRKHTRTTKSPIPSTTTAPTSSTPFYHLIIPYSHDYFLRRHPQYSNSNSRTENYIFSKENKLPKRCLKEKFYAENIGYSNVWPRRGKRDIEWSLSKLTVSQRLFYELVEKWSLLHGFLPRFCFMRILCESSEFLLPYGHSLLHDIIHILLRHTKPWAFHHKIFGRSLRRWHPVDECAKLYGLHCGVSWLDFVTTAVHGSKAPNFLP